MLKKEVNQFDKGLSLDKNDITISNHELTSALNATMTTMNGNELVLQNDMGNAKVEAAYLPSGFVPVGIKEFGGIVYVASYNPITKTSQLGSFPSPETNISNEETGQPTCVIQIAEGKSENYITSISTQSMLIEGPIRSGDKFVITSPNTSELEKEIEDDLVSLKVVIVNSDGSTIDITNELKEVNETGIKFIKNSNDTITDDDYTTYSNKISGSIYLQETLIVPDYISVNVTSDEVDNDLIKISIDPVAYCSDGTEWFTQHPKHENLLKYIYEFSSNNKLDYSTYSINGTTYTLNDNEFLVSKSDDEIVTYNVIPEYPFGRIKLLENSSSLNLSQLGTGNIIFSKFRYYNDLDNEQLSLEYDIQSYLSSGHSIEYIQLEAYKYSNKEISSEPIIVDLSISDNFGSFVSKQNYDDLKTNEMYIVRFKAKRNSSNFSKEYTSDWFCLFTCKFTNKIYNESTDSMLNISTESPQIMLDWNLNWSETIDDSETKDVNPENLNIGDGGIINENISGNSHIYKFAQKIGKLNIKLTNTLELVEDEKDFPFKIKGSGNFDISSITGNYTIDDYSSVGTYKPIDVTIPNTNVQLQQPDYNSEQEFKSSIDDSEYTISSLSTSDDTITIDYKLTSLFFAKLAENNNNQASDRYIQTYNANNISAFVPYMSLYKSSKYDIQDKCCLGDEFYYEDNGDKYTNLKSKKWFTYERWHTDGGHNRQKVGILNSPKTYTDLKGLELPSGINEPNDYGSVTLYKHDGDPNFNMYNTLISNYIKECGITPTLFMYQGCDSGGDGEVSLDKGGYIYNYTYNYSIPILLSVGREMFVAQQIKDINNSSKNMLYDIINNFSNIYVYQPNQSVSVNYYVGSYDSPTTYYYDLPYNINYKLNIKSTSNTYNFTDYENGYVKSIGSDIVHLPKFILNNTSETTNYTINCSVNSRDMSESWISTMNDSVTIGTIACIPYLKNNIEQKKIIKTAYSAKYGWVHSLSAYTLEENLEPTSIYINIGNEENPKLTKCDNFKDDLFINGVSQNDSKERRDINGSWLAHAIGKKVLVKEQQKSGEYLLLLNANNARNYKDSDKIEEVSWYQNESNEWHIKTDANSIYYNLNINYKSTASKLIFDVFNKGKNVIRGKLFNITT